MTIRMRPLVDVADLGSTVFLAGSGRSGTTWVGDVIAAQGPYRVMFEPFQPGGAALPGWHVQEYVRPADRDPRHLRPAAAILTGKVRGVWVDTYNRRFLCRRRLIKEVRANLFLKWLHEAFPAVRIVFMLRHPCAVASSRVQLGWWRRDYEDLLTQSDLVTDHLAPYADDLRAAQDPFERQVWLWCVENLVALSQLQPGDALPVFYEHLCVEPEREFRRVLAFAGADPDAHVSALHGRASVTSREWSAVLSGADPVGAWHARVSEQQAQRAREICARVGLDALYGDGDVPLVAADEVFGLLRGVTVR